MRPFPKVFLLGGVVFLFSLLAFFNSTGSFLEQQEGMLVLLDDFLVNDDVDGTQAHPSIAHKQYPWDPMLFQVIAWQDDRYGNWDIFLRHYKEIIPMMSDFYKVNDDIGTADQEEPSVAMDYDNTILVVWKDLRNGNFDIYAQLYYNNSLDSIVSMGPNFRVSDDFGVSDQHNPAVAMYRSGDFIVVWEDERNANYDIYARRYDSTGTALGSSFRVNGDVGSSDQYSPQITTNGLGNFIITWEDNRDGNPEIYAQAYNVNGTPLSANFKVNDNLGTSEQGDPDIAMDSLGGFVITWEDARNGDFDIYAQRFDSLGTPLGSNFKANTDAGTADQTNPVVDQDMRGNFVIAWEDYRNLDPDIYVQYYDSTGAAVDTNYMVSDDTTDADQITPDISIFSPAPSGYFTVTWQDSRGRTIDIYSASYGFPPSFVEPNWWVNEPAMQWFPSIALAGTGDFIIAWSEFYRHPTLYHNSIYAQRYDPSGIPLDTNFLVQSSYLNLYGTEIAADRNGNFVIVWFEIRDWSLYKWDIFARLYDSSGTPLGPDFKVNDDLLSRNQENPSVAMNSDGFFVVTWEDERNHQTFDDIYAQMYNPGGTPIGSNFLVNDFVDSVRWGADVAMDSSGNFVIAWSDKRNGHYDIYAQIFDLAGNPIGSNFLVNDDSGANMQKSPAVAEDVSGKFVITWAEQRYGQSGVWAQRYNHFGTPLGSNFRVAELNPQALNYSYPDIAMDYYGNFVITWLDYIAGYGDVFFRRYSSSGDSILGTYLIPNLEYAYLGQSGEAVAVNDSNIFFTWCDQQREPFRDSDIFAKIVDWSWRGEDIDDTLRYTGYSPIDLIVTDPAGDSIGVDFNTIPGAVYDSTQDLNDDGETDDQIIIPKPLVGDYVVRVILEPGSEGGSYTLSVKINGNDETPLVLNGTAPEEGEIDSVFYWAYPYFRGDANKDGSKSVADVVFMINYLFKGGIPIDPSHLGDCNCDESVSVSDVVFLINYLFKGGDAPCS